MHRLSGFIFGNIWRDGGGGCDGGGGTVGVAVMVVIVQKLK